METSSSSEATSGSVYVEDSGNEQPHWNLFSLLLDIETRLRAEARRDAQLQAALRRPKNAKRARIPSVTLSSPVRVKQLSCRAPFGFLPAAVIKSF
jgi:hypothetical protein